MEQVDPSRLAGGGQAGCRGMLGRPQRAAGDAGVHDGIGMVAEELGALGQAGVEQGGRLASSEQWRAGRHRLGADSCRGEQKS